VDAKNVIFKSYYPWESDSVLVAWVIHNYVDSNIKFISFEKKKERIGKDNSINTADSKLRRTARFTAFEMALKYYEVEGDACTDQLKKLIRVLEMMPWKKQEFEEFVSFEDGFIPSFPQNIGDADLSKSFSYIDSYCKKKK